MGGVGGDRVRSTRRPTRGPAYGLARLAELSDYGRDLLTTLAGQGVVVEQFHPEYAPGQLELSVGVEDPVGAADTSVLVRHTIRAVGERHGLRTSFSPRSTRPASATAAMST